MRHARARDDHVDDEYSASRGHDTSDVGKHLTAARIVPIVGDVLEQVAVAAFRHRLKEISADALADERSGCVIRQRPVRCSPTERRFRQRRALFKRNKQARASDATDASGCSVSP
jgi:hypothetical protein